MNLIITSQSDPQAKPHSAAFATVTRLWQEGEGPPEAERRYLSSGTGAPRVFHRVGEREVWRIPLTSMDSLLGLARRVEDQGSQLRIRPYPDNPWEMEVLIGSGR